LTFTKNLFYGGVGMKCPDCGREGLKVLMYDGKVYCPTCKFEKGISDYFLLLPPDPKAKKFVFTPQRSFGDENNYLIQVGIHTVGKVTLFPSGLEVGVILEISEGGVAKQVVTFLRGVFGEGMKFKRVSLRDCPEWDLKCPVCGEKSFRKVEGEDVVRCEGCKCFEMEVGNYLLSTLVTAGYMVDTKRFVDSFKIYVKRSNWFSVPIAQFELRRRGRMDITFTLRPVNGNHPVEFGKVKTFIDSLEIGPKVVVLNPQ